MMKSILFLTLSCLLTAGAASVKKPYRLERLLAGTWEYAYSFNSDTTVVFDTLSRKPRVLEFRFCEAAACNISDQNVFAGILLNNPLKNMYATHQGDRYESIYGKVSYPRITSGSKGKYQITHYLVDGNAAGKGYEYDILKLTKKELVLSSDVVVKIGGREMTFKYVYRRN